MIAKYSGTCKKTGEPFYKGDKIKWLGKGKGAELIEAATTVDSEYTSTYEWQNDAGEPMYNPIAGWRADDDYRD